MIWRYLDPRSMAVTLALTAMLLAAAIQLTSRAIGSRNLGLSFSSRGLAMAALGFMFVMLRGAGPVWWGPTVGNAFILIGTGLMLAGTLQRLGRPIPWRLLLGIWVVGAGVAIWFGAIEPHLRIRVFLLSFLLFLEAVWLTRLGWAEKRAPYRTGMRLMSAFGVVFAALMGTRMLSAALDLNVETGQPTLLSAITVLVGGMSLITANLGLIYISTGDLKKRLEHSATHDSLTGLLNRQGLRQWLNTLPPNSMIALAMVDLDHLKLINDRLGHAVGDRTIQRLADLLESVCTDTCKAVRMGGEEFVLLDADPRAVQVTEGAERVASAQFVACIEALRQALMRQEEAPQTSLSAGLSAGTVLGFEANLRVADARLYEAKRRGRNIVVVS